MENFNDAIWNRTSDLPICSTAPQPLCYRGLPKSIFTFFKHPLQYVRAKAQLISGQQFTHRCFHKCLVFVGAFTKLRKATTASSRISVRPAARNISAPTGCIFMKFHIVNFYYNLYKKFNFGYSRTKMPRTLNERLSTFMIAR